MPLTQHLIKVFYAATDLIFPPLCCGCKQPVKSSQAVHICDNCLSTTRRLVSPKCSICGVPFLTEGGTDHICEACLADPPPFDLVVSPFIYEGAIKSMIHRFKYGGKTYLRRPLAILIAEKIFSETTDSTPDIIIPVPLHSKRLRQRGFNQAILIGELVSKKLQIPLARHLLKRIRWTEPQVTLSADKREANVRGAFSITPGADIKGKRVMLLDDVMTTGSTVSECSKVLKRAGAAGVVVVTAARVGHVDDDIRETVDKTL